MVNKGVFLKTTEFLTVGDYLVSNNGLFFAIMQSDGNFCVYRGTGPNDSHGGLWCSMVHPGEGQYFAIMQSDGNFCVYKGTRPADNKGGVWCSMVHPGEGQYYAIMQDDGNFCTRKGSGPNDERGGVWCSMQIDPVVDIPEIISIDYDVKAAKILHEGPAELFRQTVKNDSDETQSSTIGSSETVTETSGWSDTLSVKVGASTTFKTGIPFVAEGKVTVSLEVSNAYTWNGSTSKAKTWTFSSPVIVPPHQIRIGLVSYTVSAIAVPYTLKGMALLKSGTKLPIQIRGIYTGKNSHDLLVTIVKQDPVTLGIESTIQKITNATFK